MSHDVVAAREPHDLVVAGAKDWLSCRPSPGLRTYIEERDFRAWLIYHFCIPMIGEDVVCVREGCNAVMDRYGDHLLTCPRRVARGHKPQV